MDLIAGGGEHAEQLVFLAQRNKQSRSDGGEFDHASCHRIVDLCQVGDEHKRLTVEQPPQGMARGRSIALLQALCERWWVPTDRHDVGGLAIESYQPAVNRAAKRVRLFQYRVEDRR